MAKGRTVDFTVRAKDQFSKVLNDLEKQQAKMSASAKAANRRNLLSVASDEIKAASDSYKRATADIERYRQAQQNLAKTGASASQASVALGNSIAVTRQKARESMQALQQNRAALNQLTGASTSGFLAFNRIATVMEKSSAASQAESVAVAQTAAQLNKLTTSSNTAATAQTRLKNQLSSTTAAVQRQRVSAGGRGSKGDAQEVELYGLKPWQMTNLGYQINDVVSGLAMGQRPMQVFAQQAGQIAQIWPNTMVALVRSIPQLIAFSAAAAPFIAAALRMRAAAANLKFFQEQLAFSANGGDYNVQQLANLAEGFREIGVSSDDARKLIMKFANQGMSTTGMKELVTMAKDLASFTGNTVAEEADRLSKAFSGSGSEIVKLNEDLNFLTASQLESVYAMIRNKDATGAMTLAQEALAKSLRSTKSESSSWSQAAKSMGEAWNELVKLAQRTGVVAFLADEWNRFGNDLNNVAKGIKYVATIGQTDFKSLASEIENLRDKIAELQKFGSGDADIDLLNIGRLQDDLDAALLKQRELIQLTKDEGLLTAETAASLEARRIAEVQIQEKVNEKLGSLREEQRLAEMTNRERFIEQQVLDARNKALEESIRLGRVFKELNEQTTAEIRAQAGALYDTTNRNYEAQYVAGKGTPQGAQMEELIKAVVTLSEKMQISAKDLLTAMSYETGGTFDPWKAGPTTKWGQHRGLIQWGEPQAQKYGVSADTPIAKQVEAAGKYLTDAGVKAGDGLLQIYAAINAGNAKNTHLSDEKNGGAPGTVLDKVSEQMDGHKARADGLLAAYAGVVTSSEKAFELDKKRLETEKEYVKDFNKRIEMQQFELGLISKSSREAAIAKAIKEEENKAIEAGLTLTKERRAEVERLAAAEFDNKNANLEVNQLMEQRKALLESLQIAQAAGDVGKSESVVEQISAIELKLQSAIQSAIAFWKAIGGEGADAAILSLQNMEAGLGKTISNMQTKFLPTAEQLNEQLADIGSNAFSSFAQAIANGENAAQAFFNSLLQGLAEFLIEIGKAIIKQTLFNALTDGKSGGGGIGGIISGAIGGLFGAKHTGGIIGQAGMMRMVDPSVFAGAAKHHGGGVIGRLASNEVPIIGLKDEEVLTTDDPRHVYNGGGSSGGTAVNIKQVNVLDPVELLSHSLADVEGERVLLNVIGRNPSKFKSALGL